MASHRGKLKQYLLIIQKLKKTPNCTYEDIQAVLESNDFVLSKRTFQRNLEALRDEFGVEVKCNRHAYTYSIDEEQSINISYFIQFLHTAIKTEFVAESIRDFKNIAQYIHLSDVDEVSGLEHLPTLLSAIKSNKTIAFVHENYITQRHKSYTAEPHLLKEYMNRWYLIAYVPAIKDFRTFGIDRIRELKLTPTTFVKQAKDTRDYFDNILGINFQEYDTKPTEVLFVANEYETKYLRSKPLHHSQDEVESGKFKLLVIPNYELKQRLLMFGKAVTVIQPTSLRDEMIEMLKDTLKNYQS